jgi:hypothetical protein
VAAAEVVVVVAAGEEEAAAAEAEGVERKLETEHFKYMTKPERFTWDNARPRPNPLHEPPSECEGKGHRPLVQGFKAGPTLAARVGRLLLVAMSLVLPVAAIGANQGQIFPKPEDAVAALRTAVATYDSRALGVLFGPGVEDLYNPDRVQATNDFRKFGDALVATNYLHRMSDTNIILEVGNDAWPFPVPIVKTSAGWRFDVAAGEEEIINRRIGMNELEVLKAVRGYVDAQREYASKDRDGDRVLEYAQKIKSSPGQTDGLYWPIELNGEESPLGPLVADARGEGYFGKAQEADAEAGPQPFHGYYFKILRAQGKHAPGGKYNYIINGNMIGGFALVAWPADYEDSGIMSFIVNQEGRVYQKDLGSKTEKIAKGMTEYDPDPTWKVSPD